MKYRFFTCDVFTETKFGGNPLAVFPEAEGLSTEQMQKIANELNLSETTFVLPGSGEFTRQVRIFTPSQEVPFAGHPNVGTAFTLASLGELGTLESETCVLFDEKAGPVPISINKENDRISCELKAPSPLTIGDTFSVAQIAEALGLNPSQIATGTHEPQAASVGLAFIMVELVDRSALAAARANVNVFEEINATGNMPYLFLYVRSNDEFDIRARMYAPLDGILEDPATGSATCALVALLTHYQQERDGDFTFRVGQGIEMMRPSLLEARTEKRNGKVTGVWVGGTCVSVMEGSIEI